MANLAGLFHNMSSCLVIEDVVEMPDGNLQNAERKHWMGLLARVLGIPGGFDGVVDAVMMLRAEIGIPHTLAEIGVPADQASTLAALALADPLSTLNPRPVDLSAYEALYTQAFQGSVLA